MIAWTRQLTKTYGATAALRGVDLNVPEGGVYGLVGPNGAGKTTLLKVLSGLARPTAGEVNLAVAPSEWAMCPDTPQFEPWLTASEVIRLAGSLGGRPPSADRVEQLLTEAGLADAVDRRVGGFSRGMTQRLALAATIVAEPRLVILDEPCSALDPAGRVKVLDLVARAGDRSTVVFSSHVLADVERVCDTVGVLGAGQLIYQGPLAELLDRYTQPTWRIDVRGHRARTVELLKAAPWVDHVAVAGDLIEVTATEVAGAEAGFASVLHEAGAPLVSLQPVRPDLETVFLALTNRPSP